MLFLLDLRQPSKCTYCKLPSAFIGSKCQRCSSSQKKYGNPVSCQNCDLKAAFDHSKARVSCFSVICEISHLYSFSLFFALCCEVQLLFEVDVFSFFF